jgi:hypothetical protein
MEFYEVPIDAASFNADETDEDNFFRAVCGGF